jgi:hypothetical protein
VSGDKVTYYNASLGHSSFIDHFFVTTSLRQFLQSIFIVDTGANLSDHRPLVGCFDLSSVLFTNSSDTVHIVSKQASHCAWRWDKSDVSQYYEASRIYLSDVQPLTCTCSDSVCNNTEHLHSINLYYDGIVRALHKAATTSIVRVKCGSFKPYWNDELDRLKADSIFWHNLWLSASRPPSGVLHRIKTSCKLKYKIAIRDAYIMFENSHDDAILSHFINKKPNEFWKSWQAKFRKNINSSIVIPGCHSNKDIANAFSCQFRQTFHESNTNVDAVNSFIQELASSDNSCPMPNITVEIIDRCMKDLHLGKACGPDDLSVEHLLYAHPSLITHLKLLFSAILFHGVVPDNFGAGTIVPLIKDKSGNLNDVSNYRPITLIPVISKLFECIILNLCQECFVVDELQLGFKKNHGCNDAIFAVKTTVNYFTERGSCVYAAALDLSKAFDSVNHFKLFSSLLNAGLPVGIISVICNWYSKMFAAVRWGNAFSDSFHVGSGVRQGGTLSPSLFNTFINLIIVD